MRSFTSFSLLLAGATTIATTAAAAAISSPAADPQQPYSTRMIQSVMTRQQSLVSSGAVTSTLESGLIALSLQSWLRYYDTNTSTSSDISAYVDAMLATIAATQQFTNISQAVSLPLDRLSVGQAIVNLDDEDEGSSSTGDRQLTENEVLALDTLTTSLTLQERNQYGGFWYYVYPHWSYLDGAISFLPFMVASTSWSYADALHQISLLWTFCAQQPPQTNNTNTTTGFSFSDDDDTGSGGGLLVHGYDASKTAVWAHPVTGGSPYVWGRSLGWYLMGLVNAWEVLLDDSCEDDDDTAARTELQLTIQSQFTSLVHHLVPYADAATGAWWQLPTFPGRAGNFLESSSTALFAFSILKGLRLGLLPSDEEVYHHSNATTSRASLTEVALRAYYTLVNDFVVDYGNGTLGYNGTVTVCSLNSTATYEYYTQRPINFNAPLGEGAFILASLEVERLGL